MTLQRSLGFVLLVVLPGLLWSAYIYISRMMRAFSTGSDYMVLVLSLGIGILGVLMLYKAPRVRLIGSLAYLLVAAPGMYLGYVSSLCYFDSCP